MRTPEPRALPLLGLALALCLSACGEEPAPPKPNLRTEEPPPQAAPAAPASNDPLSRRRGAEDAAQVVQRYYALIEGRRYGEAYKLREPASGAPSAEAFAANFNRYAEYHVTVGTPSEPVESGGWLYVEVPVQPYGRMKNGTSLSSAGTITLRRKDGGNWRIFTKG